MKRFLKVLSVVLALVMLFQVVAIGIDGVVEELSGRPRTEKIPAGEQIWEPLTAEEAALAAAASPGEENANRAPSPLLGEDISQRSNAFTRYFRHSNGLYTAALYNDPVQFLNDRGAWQDIDNTLREERDAAGNAYFTPTASGLDLRIPRNFSDGQSLTMGKDGYIVGLRMIDTFSQREAQPPADEDADTVVEEETQPTTEPETTTEAETTTEPEATTEAATEPETTTEAETTAAVEDTQPEDEVLVNMTLSANANSLEDTSRELEVAEPAMRALSAEGQIRQLEVEKKEPAPAKTRAEQIERDNAEAMEVKNLNSAVFYEDMVPGTDVEYRIGPNWVSEYKIVKELQREYIYHYQLTHDGLVPVQQEDGSISFFKEDDTAEPLFVLEAPYMFDAAGEYSTAVTMTLYEDGLLVLTADAAWVNAPERVLPVTIDPTLTKTIDYTAMEDLYVNTDNSGNSNAASFAGRKADLTGGGINRAYMKFTLPTLPSGSVVAAATLHLFQNEVTDYKNNMFLYAFECPHPWNFQTGPLGMWYKWDPQPLYSASDAPSIKAQALEANGAFKIGLRQLDAVPIQESSGILNLDVDYHLDLTKAVRNWYENGNNNGVMLTTNNEGTDIRCKFYSTRSNMLPGFDYLRPSVSIYYSTNVGLESQWAYESVDMGRSGGIFVNHYNGHMTYIHNDINMTGNRLPISISHVNNSNHDNNSGTYQSMKLGVGFRLNIMEQLIAIATNDPLYAPNILKENGVPVLDKDGNAIDLGSYRYKLIDGDGTVHYFKEKTIKENGVNTIKTVHEYDSTQEFVASCAHSPSHWMLTDTQGNEKHYSKSHGYLVEIVDHNKNRQVITWSGGRITKVTDPALREVLFDYNTTTNYLNYIEDPAGRRTLFTYTGDQLTTITYPGGKTTKFLYNGSDISRVTATDNSYASVTYKSVQYNSGRRVSNISRRDKAGAEVDYLAFKYSETNASGQFTGSTEVKNKYDKWNRYFYNVLGGVTSAQNQDGYRQFGVTHIDNIKDGNKFNKVMASSDLQTIATNLLKNHGFEYTNTQWTRYYLSGSPGTIARSSQETKRGEWSMRVQSNTVNTYDAAGQAVTGTPGEIYTLSADVKIPEPLTTANGGAWIGFEYSVGGTWYKVKSEFVTSTSGWTRLVNTFQLPPNAATSFRVLLALETSKGTVYFDNVQLEQSGGSRHYNLVDNSDFSDAPGANQNPTGAAATNWIMTGVDTGDGVQYRPAPLDRNFVMMTGNPLKTKAITQTVYVNAKAGETLIIGGEAAAYAGNFPAKEHSFSIKALIYPTANGPALQQSVYVDFDPNVSMHFQTVAASIPLDTDCHRIDFSFIYDKQIGNVSFSDAFVYVGNFGESYEYDDDGQLTELRKNEYEKTSYTYEDNKLVAVDHAYGGIEGNIVSMEYNNNGNLLRMSNKDAVTEFTYNSQDNGQIKSQTVTQNSSSGEILTYTETMTYIQGGNYLEEETDARGGKTKYTYDTDRGLLTKVKDPKGNETVYSYDLTTDELLSVTGSGATTSFTTQNDLLKSITRNGTTYSYDYDNQNRITNAKVGTQNIVTNAYDSRQRLSQQTYGNGTVYAPVYDSRDRMVGEKWNNVQTAEFFYNENGQLSKLVDQTTNTAYSYSYYFDGLVRKISGSDGSLTEFNYDVNGAVASLTHSLNNSILHDATYTRNGNGSPIMATLYSLDGAGLDYEYDALGRLTERRLSTASASLSNSVSYLEVNGNTTNFVETYTNEDSYLGVLQHYEYEYDKNGNITSVTDVNGRTTTYTYDGLNRLTGETGPFGTYKYNYDIGGNLTSVTKDGKTLNSYTYGHANWKDRLTAFGGKPISYDAIGNPTSYDSQSFTWEKGRQLASITGNGQDVSYTYDAQGRRTSKTVGGVNGVTTHYTYAGDLLIRQSDGTDTLDFAYDAGGIAVGFTHNGTPYYYLRNLQGDVVAITDAEGTIVAEYHYDAWGNQIDIVPVTGICIGVRTSNQTRPILSNGLPEPFTVFYNATSDTDHSVRLTPNVSPTDASIKGVTWSAARVLDSHEPSTLPTFNAVSGTTARLVKPSKTTAPNGQFIREYTAETDDGGFTAQQIVIGVERLPNPMKTEKIYTAADAFSGPYDDEQSTFPLLDTLVQDTQIQVRGRYDADWYYITWGNNNWGYIKLDDALCGCGLHGCNYCECDCQLCKPCTCGLHECPYCVCDPHTCPTCECSCNICDPCECGLHECVYCECFCEICVSERFAIEFLEMALLANALRTAGVPASLVMPVAAQIMPMGILSSGRYLLETNPVTADELIFVIQSLLYEDEQLEVMFPWGSSLNSWAYLFVNGFYMVDSIVNALGLDTGNEEDMNLAYAVLESILTIYAYLICGDEEDLDMLRLQLSLSEDRGYEIALLYQAFNTILSGEAFVGFEGFFDAFEANLTFIETFVGEYDDEFDEWLPWILDMELPSIDNLWALYDGWGYSMSQTYDEIMKIIALVSVIPQIALFYTTEEMRTLAETYSQGPQPPEPSFCGTVDNNYQTIAAVHFVGIIDALQEKLAEEYDMNLEDEYDLLVCSTLAAGILYCYLTDYMEQVAIWVLRQGGELMQIPSSVKTQMLDDAKYLGDYFEAAFGFSASDLTKQFQDFFAQSSGGLASEAYAIKGGVVEQEEEPGFFGKLKNFFTNLGNGGILESGGGSSPLYSMGGVDIGELNPIRYRGYYYDEETGYYFLQTRYYNPEWRRFLNADVLFIAGDDPLNAANMYAYCNGNPVMYVDPSGMGFFGELFSHIWNWAKDGVNEIRAADGFLNKATIAMGLVTDVIDVLRGLKEAYDNTLGPIIKEMRYLSYQWKTIVLPMKAFFYREMVPVFAGLVYIVAGFVRWGSDGLGAIFPQILPVTALLSGACAVVMTICEWVVPIARFLAGVVDVRIFINNLRGELRGWNIVGEMYAEGGIVPEEGDEEDLSPSPPNGMQSQGTGGTTHGGAQTTSGGMYQGVRQVHEVYLDMNTAANLYALDSNYRLGIPEDIPGVVWRKINVVTGKDNLVVAQGPNPGSNSINIIAIGLCDLVLLATIGDKFLAEVRVVSVTKLQEPYVAVAKYTNTNAVQNTANQTRSISLNARDDSLAAPNIKVIGEHNTNSVRGDYYLAEVWEYFRSSDGWTTANPTVRLVAKEKPLKTNPVEKQNISKVVWPIEQKSANLNLGDNKDGTNSRYGYRTYGPSYHQGVDLYSHKGLPGTSDYSKGLPVYAIMDGEVKEVVNVVVGTARGSYVIIEHKIAKKGGEHVYRTLYQHLEYNSILVAEGQFIAAGKSIATAGNTGNSGKYDENDKLIPFSQHLHYQVHRNATDLINPLKIYNTDDIRNKYHVNLNPMFIRGEDGYWKFTVRFDWGFGTNYKSGSGKEREDYFTGYTLTPRGLSNPYYIKNDTSTVYAYAEAHKNSWRP